MSISTERAKLALQRIDWQSAFEFESFANAFLASEFPDLRPIAGMHDGARDAVLYRSDDDPTTVVQYSVTPKWQTKINDTIRALEKNGHVVRELVYGTNRDIIADVDSYRAQLRQRKIRLDVRDINYFVAHCNASPDRVAATERLAQRFVDPLLTNATSAGTLSPALTTEDERIAATFLRLELVAMASEKNVTKSVFDSLITFALRDTSPDTPMPRAKVVARVHHVAPQHPAPRIQELVDSALARLAKRGLVRHHTKEDAFTLPHATRLQLAAQVQTALAEDSDLQSHIEKRLPDVASSLNIDFDYDVEHVTGDAMMILDRLMCEQGRLSALALVGKGNFSLPRETITDHVERMAIANSSAFQSSSALSAAQITDLVPAVVDDLFRHPNRETLMRIARASNAYCLLFSLQQTTDIQRALKKLLAQATILVDTSIVVPAVAEHLLPREQQRMSNLLRAASSMGFRLIIGEDVINELETHLERMRWVFSQYGSDLTRQWRAGHLPPGEAPIIVGYLADNGATVGSFDEYLERFMGKENPAIDLIQFAESQFGVKYDPLKSEMDAVSDQDVGTLVARWKTIKRRRSWVDESTFDTLVTHDVRAYLLMEAMRAEERPDQTLGYRSWWLTQDGTARKFDRERRDQKRTPLCMSPDFFARYVSLYPKSHSTEEAQLIPASVEYASLGLLPPEVRREAERLYEQSASEPEYIRRRKLRELVHRAFTADAEGDDVEPQSIAP